jgi:hypothetical protein
VLASAEDGNADQITEARRRIACVITGTAAGLPGGEFVFQSDNLEKLIHGKQCITPVSGHDKMAMLEKNVVQVKKFKDGSTKREPVDTEAGVIKLADNSVLLT